MSERTDAQVLADLEALPEGVPEALDGLFGMCGAIGEHELTVNDLEAGCRLAIANGFDMAQIQLCMMLRAVEIAQEESER